MQSLRASFTSNIKNQEFISQIPEQSEQERRVFLGGGKRQFDLPRSSVLVLLLLQIRGCVKFSSLSCSLTFPQSALESQPHVWIILSRSFERSWKIRNDLSMLCKKSCKQLIYKSLHQTFHLPLMLCPVQQEKQWDNSNIRIIRIRKVKCPLRFISHTQNKSPSISRITIA